MALLVYILLRYLGGPPGRMLLYPVTLLVTFLHEFGHGLGAVLTGGTVEGMQVNADGSGFTITRGGSRSMVLMGGYLGSVILGNLLLLIGARYPRLTHHTLLVLAGLMVLAGLLWFQSLTSTLLLWGFGLTLGWLSYRTRWGREILIFLGLAAVFYIIQDFNVGPQSDLRMYEQVVGVFPATIWMFIWLFLAVVISWWNFRQVLRW